MMSLVALALGATIYLARRPLITWHEAGIGRTDARVVYNALVNGLIGAALRVTRAFDTGSLQRQVFLFVGAALALGGAPWLAGETPLTGSRAGLPPDAVSLTVAATLILATIATVIWHRRRFTALVTIGVVGLVVSLAFIKFSAPDLALTQLSVEVVTIVLLLLALYFLPQHGEAEQSRARVRRDAVIALVAGLGTAALAWAVLTRPYDTIAGYFLENSKPRGGGTNVVNVILVDFRGYDTLGEITVLALAGLGIVALLQNLKLAAPLRDATGRLWNADAHPVIMATLTRILLPLALLVGAFIFLRGHNVPGGGFIAGLVVAIALIMQYMASGHGWAAVRMKVDYHALIGIGVLTAAATGVVAWLADHPFLTSAFGHFHLPLVGEFELASAMAFDTGVFLTVVGAVMLALANLSRIGVLADAPPPQDGPMEPDLSAPRHGDH